MTLDRLESQEVQDAATQLERELQNWPDLDPETRKRIQDAIAHTRSVNTQTSPNTMEELQREVNSLESSLAGLRREGSRMGGMERMPAAPERMPEINIARERERIQRCLQHNTPPLSEDQIDLLQRRSEELDELDRDISINDVITHAEFERVVREGHTRLRKEGRTRHLSLFPNQSVEIIRRGLLQARGEIRNAFSHFNPIGEREQYELFLRQGVVQDAVNAARRAIYSQRVPNPTDIESILNVPPRVEPAAAPASVEPQALPTENPAPGAADAAPQAGAPPRSADAARTQGETNVTADDHNETIRKLREELAKLRADTGGGSRATGIEGGVHIYPPGYMPGGQYIPTGAGVMSGFAQQPQAPGLAPEAHAKHEKHQHETHTPVTNEAERQKLRNEYDRLEKEQNDIIAQGLHLEDKDGAKARQLFEKMKALKAEQRKVCLTLFGPQFDSMVQAERERMAKAGPAHPEAPHGHEASHAQPTAAEAQNAVRGVAEVNSYRRRDYERWARTVAGKDDPDRVRKWMWAPKRWLNAFIREVPTGFTAVKAGFGGTALATWLGLPAWMSSSLGAIPIAVPVLGGAALPGLAAIAAGMVGAYVWKKTGHRLLGLNDWENYANKGWQANKAMRTYDREVKRGLKRGYTPDAARIYEVVRSRPQWRRLELIPRILGGAAGGYLGYDTTAALRRGLRGLQYMQRGAGNLYNQGLPGLQNRGLGLWQGISEWFGNLFQGGTRGDPRCSAVDHSEVWRRLNAVDFSHDIGIRPDVEGARSLDMFTDPALWDGALRPNVPQSNIPQPNVPQPNIPQPNIPQPNIPQPNVQQPNIPLDPNVDGPYQNPGVQPQTPQLPAEPQSAPQPQPQQAPPRRPDTLDADLAAQWARSREIFHIPSGRGGVWSAAEGMWQRQGFDGRALTWLTDMVEDYTQDGSVAGTRRSSYFVDNLLERITGRNGVMQTTIPTNTTLRMEELFGDRAIYEDMVRRISQAPYSELSPLQKQKAMDLLEDWLLKSLSLRRLI